MHYYIDLFKHVTIYITNAILLNQMCRSPESMDNANIGVDASSSCGSDVLSASQTQYAKKEFIMIPPEEKLKHFENQAQIHEDNQEVGTVDCRLQ